MSEGQFEGAKRALIGTPRAELIHTTTTISPQNPETARAVQQSPMKHCCKFSLKGKWKFKVFSENLRTSSRMPTSEKTSKPRAELDAPPTALQDPCADVT